MKHIQSLSKPRAAASGFLSFAAFALIESLFCYLFSGKFRQYYLLSFALWMTVFALFYLLGIELLVKKIFPKLMTRFRKRADDPLFILTLLLITPMFFYTTVQICNFLPGRFYSISNLFLILLNLILFYFFTLVLYDHFGKTRPNKTISNFIFYAILFGFSSISGVFLIASELQGEHWFAKLVIVFLFCITIPFLSTLLFTFLKHGKWLFKSILLSLFILLLLLLELEVALPLRDHLIFQQQPSTGSMEKSNGPGGKPPNIILIVMDTTRASNMSLYGYHRSTTPNLEQFASDAVVFTHALSSAPWTLPSHASLFTGLHSSLHGATHGKTKETQGLPLDNEFNTMAEILTANGYTTGAVTANTAFLAPWTGLNQGFEFFWWGRSRDDVLLLPTMAALFLKPDHVDKLKTICGITGKNAAKRINQIARNWLKKVKNKRPWFLFINYMETHGMKYLPPPYAEMFTKPPAMKMSLRNSKNRDNTGLFFPKEQELQKLRSWYDNELASLDNEIGLLFKFLKEKNLFYETLIVVTSDHGELLGEHHDFGHGFWLYHELLHVPLIIKYPFGKSKGEVNHKMVQNIDIFAELLEQAHINLPPYIQGQPLNEVTHPIMSSIKRNPTYKDRWPARYDKDLVALYSRQHNQHKLILSSRGSRNLYDLEQDPGEINTISRFPQLQVIEDELNSYLDFLKQFKGLMPVHRAKKLDKATKDRLRSLGYIK